MRRQERRSWWWSDGITRITAVQWCCVHQEVVLSCLDTKFIFWKHLNQKNSIKSIKKWMKTFFPSFNAFSGVKLPNIQTQLRHISQVKPLPAARRDELEKKSPVESFPAGKASEKNKMLFYHCFRGTTHSTSFGSNIYLYILHFEVNGFHILDWYALKSHRIGWLMLFALTLPQLFSSSQSAGIMLIA